MTLRVSLSALACAAVVAAGCSSMGSGMGMMGSAPAKTADGALVGSTGMTLYTFDRDAAGSGKSVCNGQCATNWPPLMAAKPTAGTGVKAGLLGTTKRKTGAKQVTYAGHPLYYFKLDKAAGQTNGEGLDFFGGKWYGVNAAGRAVKHAQAGGGGGTTTTPTTTTNPYGY